MLTRWHLLWKWLQLRRTANLPRAAVERRRQRQFTKLLAYVNKHSAYYRRIITQRQLNLQTATPDDFPVLTKPDLIEHFDEIVTTPAVTRQRVQEFLSSSRDPNE